MPRPWRLPHASYDNAGFDATNILNKLQAQHAQGGTWYGVDINNEDTADNFKVFMWEPATMQINALTAASEAACLIVSADVTSLHRGCSSSSWPGLGPRLLPLRGPTQHWLAAGYRFQHDQSPPHQSTLESMYHSKKSRTLKQHKLS
ncbi:T-complex protein 1 subunit eta-like [Fukomys damarensis]|uniref:T-complex protein 1 subunit eta-like n=1 Tax=Fukomys damarensis TaxID=885580 RepID=UPI001454F5A5|nr:T-complex protein 1 subunit eta-like [Fukomys damarensis]